MQDDEIIALDAFQQQPQPPQQPVQQQQPQPPPQNLVQQEHQPQPDQDDINDLENLPPLAAAAGFALVPSRKASDDADAAAGSPPRQFGADRPV
jgi:hypothetical protein